MSKHLNKSYIFFKNLYRPGIISPPKDKKLTIVHKALVSYALKPRKIRDIPDTIDYFEWDHVKKKIKFRLFVAIVIGLPIMSYFAAIKPIRRSQDRWMEKAERRKFGETRENDTSFFKWYKKY